VACRQRRAGSGPAYRVAESRYRLDIPHTFAALILLSAARVVSFFAVSWLMLRRWHESALARERRAFAAPPAPPFAHIAHRILPQ
jgi:hypothetical protein